MTTSPTYNPIFIVGMNGSGTTMLLDCLNNHNDLHGFRRETRLIPYYIKNIGRYGDLTDDENFLSLINDFRNLSFFRYVNGGAPPPLPDNWKAMPRSLASAIDSVFSYFARKDGKKRWCEKTPMHAQHIASLSNLFPDAQFIHIIRDGRACAASFYRRWHYTPELTMYRWKNVIREARRQSRGVKDRYLEIRYEALTENPETTMRSICDFLQIPYQDDLLTLSRKRSHTGSTKKAITPNKASWNDYLSNHQIERVEAIGGQLLDELGYETTHPRSDKDPNAIALKYWLYRDLMREGVSSIVEEIQTPKKQKWDDFSARIIRAVRQRLTSKY